jgi:ribulose-bisphosphate carboxylase small chain
MPMFDLHDAAGVMLELKNCRKTFPQHYIRLMAFDSTRGVETIVMSFIVNRPANEPGFGVVRQEARGRTLRYTVRGLAER